MAHSEKADIETMAAGNSFQILFSTTRIREPECRR